MPSDWAVGSGGSISGFLEGQLAGIAFNGGAALVVPMRHHDRLLGVLAVQPARPSTIDERMVTVCNAIAAHLAMGVANARLYQQLQREHQDLLRSEQAREQLTQMVAHDLKNPLTAVRVNLDLLQMTGLSDEQQEMVEDAYHGRSSILQLISDMLDVARLEDGRLELRRVSTDVTAFLHGCVDELHAWSEQLEKRIVVESAQSLAPLAIDIALMRRVIINLLSNALKHTPAGTAITVGAAASEDGARLWIHDDGPGIPLDQQRDLFERWSGAKTENTHQSSTGLGLTFCKLAVETHGGTIQVDSAPGSGTTFTITLPLGDTSAD